MEMIEGVGRERKILTANPAARKSIFGAIGHVASGVVWGLSQHRNAQGYVSIFKPPSGRIGVQHELSPTWKLCEGKKGEKARPREDPLNLCSDLHSKAMKGLG